MFICRSTTVITVEHPIPTKGEMQLKIQIQVSKANRDQHIYSTTHSLLQSIYYRCILNVDEYTHEV